MPADQERNAEQLFHEALELAPEERAELIDRACRDDASLRAEVETLLSADHRATDFLADPAWSLLSGPANQEGGVVEPGLPAERLGDCRLLRELGRGGMGVVYEAMQEPLGRRVAVKVIHPARVGSPEIQARFWREVDVVADLRHPSVVTVYGGGEQQGISYFTMELIDGRGLEEILAEAAARGEPPETERILRWILEIAQGLDHAHASEIIHRDVKPSNIRINSSDRAMLMDFGVARDEARSSLTISGEFRGTPHYASPEQIRGSRNEIDARTDVYSLGVTLYEATTGRVPFDGETTQQVFRLILESDPETPRRLRPSISIDLETVIIKAMEKDRRRRYANMEAFADDLRRLLAGEPIEARPPGWMRRTGGWMRRHRRTVVGAAGALLLLLGWLTASLVVSQLRQASARAAEEVYVPLHETLGSAPSSVRNVSAEWGLAADPGDPNCHLLQALIEVDREYWPRAGESLDRCIAACGPRGEAYLESDAHFLLGLVHSAQVVGATEEGERERFRRLATAAFEQAARTKFDPSKALISRSTVHSNVLGDFDPSSLSELRLNPNHHILHFFVAMSIVMTLHRGGEIERFESAIANFEEVLKKRPDHRISLTYLGRTYYFLAQFHGFIEVTTRAEECLKKELEISGDQSSHVTLNTLGSVSLLRGECEKALEWNEKALDHLRHQDPRHEQNIYTSLGYAQANLGRLDEAQSAYRKALEIVPHDSTALLAMAEICLRQGDLEEALRYASQSTDTWHPPPYLGFTAADVVMACVHLRRGEVSRGVDLLGDIYSSTKFSANDLGRACLLLATVPRDLAERTEHRGQGLEFYLSRLSYLSGTGGMFEGQRPAIGHSAVGAYCLVAGKYQEAIDEFRQAISRRECWPATAREFYWSEDARDQYFLAMAHHGLASGDSGHQERARKCFEAAEAAYSSGRVPIGDADVILRARERAREVLGRSD